MNVEINKWSETPIYKQIENGIRTLIRKNELVHGYKLPSERKLAEELGVHRNTVIKAYMELIAEGLIVSSRTSPRGYFILNNQSCEKGNQFFPLSKMIRYNFSSKEKTFAKIFDESNSPNYISLAGIVMDSNFSPATRMEEIFEKMKVGFWSQNVNKLNDNETDRLKMNICNLLRNRNMYINKRNVQIVSETTQAISHIIDLYLKEGDCIIAEEPTIPDTVNVFRNKGVEVVGLPLEEDGLNLKELELLMIEKKPKFIYLMPNFHNPTGKVMSLEKRLGVLEISYKYGVPIIEDDALRDFNYTDMELPSLYSLDKCKSVLYIDTFTLTFLPGIKTAFVVGPYEPIEMIGQYIVMSQVCISNIGQYMLNEFIESGKYNAFLTDMRAYYRHKRDLLIEELHKLEKGTIQFESPQGGLFIWCSVDSRISEKKLLHRCKELGLLIMPGYIFYPNGYQGGGHIRLCFSNITDEQIGMAGKILEHAIEFCIETMNEEEDEYE